MNDYICLDSSVIIKVLTWEEKSEEAAEIFNKIINKKQIILLPEFAWAEIGSVLRKKIRMKLLDKKDADILWDSFINLGNIEFIHFSEISTLAWEISKEENLPTLYDAAFLAVCEKYEIEEFWTDDKKLINSIKSNKSYIKKI
jgi:predicted nucleic acid-binding protein